MYNLLRKKLKAAAALASAEREFLATHPDWSGPYPSDSKLGKEIQKFQAIFFRR